MSTSTNDHLRALQDQLNTSYKEYTQALTSYRKHRRVDTDEYVDALRNATTTCLAEIGEAARNGAENLSPEDLKTLLESAARLESKIVNTTDSMGDKIYEHIPAYCGNHVKDENMGVGAGHLAMLMSAYDYLVGPTDRSGKSREEVEEDLISREGGPVKYDPSLKPSEHSSLLARFCSGRPPVPSDAPAILRNFAEGRCEITCDTQPVVINMCLSGSVLALQGAGGHKSRDPTLHLHDVSPGKGFGTSIFIDVGLSGIANHLQIDGHRKLAYVADASRIKSYRWNLDSREQTEAKRRRREVGSSPVHTFKSKGYGGSMVFKDKGAKLLRAGKKGVAMWDIDTASTHGEDGNDVVGEWEERYQENTLRSAYSGEIEASEGSPPTHVLASSALSSIDKWTENPRSPNEMIVGYRTRADEPGEERFGCVSVDLETKQAATRYVGHGGNVTCIETSEDDPSSFMTAATDGVVRLYDIRAPAPILAVSRIAAHSLLYHNDESIDTALWEHIGSHPFFIIGGTSSEQVKVWDVRAQLPLYELSTGNNQVNALAWDSTTQTLYAGTECQYHDHYGQWHDYRRAKPSNSHESNNRCPNWPNRGFHSEAAFDRLLDSAEDRIYAYNFKEDADPTLVPDSGLSERSSRGLGLW